jgi:tetratricopeptide (TPR) repeat protein
VNASNAARIESGYRDIADQVKLAGRNDPQANVFELVSKWLRNEKNGKWLLVLDDVDDLASLSPPSGDGQQRLSRYLPPSRHGAVLITSRSKQAARCLVEDSNIIQIEPMHGASAQALLEKKLGDGVGKDGIAELANVLDFMPLALVQAAAYIRQRAPRCSVQQFLEKFYKSDENRTSLLDYDKGSLWRDEAATSLLVTFQVSFNHIRQTRPSAADLLSLMSFFDRDEIPEKLIRNQYRTGNRYGGVEATNADSDSCDGDDSEFEDDILMLRSYSFITLAIDGTTFAMSRLVQLATRKWLKDQGQLERWKEQCITNLLTEFPTGAHINWAQCQMLFPHVYSTLLQPPPKSEQSLQQWAELLYRAARYAWKKGSLSDTMRLSVNSMKVRKRLLGEEDTDTLSSMAMVGLAAKLAGRLREAEELEVQVMEKRKRVLGEEHPDTLNSMANLASTYWYQGRWKEVEELRVQVMEKRMRVLGAEHPDVLTSMADLASTYRYQGRLDEAEALEVQVMETRKRVLGEEHPDTLNSVANLASTYRYKGRFHEAEALEVQVMETRKRVLGEEHPDTLNSMANLASTYRNQGRWKEAEELEVQVMEKRKRVLGEEHLDTISINNEQPGKHPQRPGPARRSSGDVERSAREEEADPR